MSPTLGRWVQRQRACYAERELAEERVQILHALGFRFDFELPGFDRGWELKFDAYENWIIRMRETREWIDETGLNWVRLGGWHAAQLAVWAISQRQRRRNGTLPADLVKRLDYFRFNWDVPTEDRRLREWFLKFGQLVVAVDKHTACDSRSKVQLIVWMIDFFVCRRKAYSLNDISFPEDETGDRSADGKMHAMQSAADRIEQSDWWRRPVHEISARNGIPKLDRMKALSLAPEIEHWLNGQRSLWRQGKLPLEKAISHHRITGA